MNRYDAHLIAEELMKLMSRDYSKDCILDAEQLGGRLGVSPSWVYHKGESLPRIKVGHSYRYSLNEVIQSLKG